MPIVIAGLGNPGKKYEGTRHNVGWMLIQRVAEKCDVKFGESKYQAYSATIEIEGLKVVLMMPQTYMNLSGQAVVPCARDLGCEPSDVLAIVDEIQFPVGRMKLSSGGSDGGHNGLASLIEDFEDDGFRRMRIGVGPAPKDELKDFVLSDFRGDEKDLLDQTLELGSEALIHWFRNAGGENDAFAKTMNHYNAKNLQPVEVLRKKEALERQKELEAEEAKNDNKEQETNMDAMSSNDEE